MQTRDQHLGATARIVVVDATVEVAPAVRTRWPNVTFVQLPGTPADRLIGDRSNLYTVDFTDSTFLEFIDKVLRPLAPDAALSLTGRGAPAAALIARTLGLPEVSSEQAALLLRGV